MAKSKSRGRSKGRRGRKGKKIPLTDEEKAAKALKKARDEHEKRVKRQRLTHAFLNIKRKKEYELIKACNAKLVQHWRPLLRKMKIKELLEDYKMMHRAFERAYDKKAGLINDLAGAMDKNEEEYDSAVDMHMFNIDKMMEFFRARMKGVMHSYTIEKNKLMESLSEEQNYIKTSHGKDMQSIRGAIAQSERQKFLANQDAEDELRMKEEIFRTNEAGELSSFQYKIECRITDLWKETHDSILNFALWNAKKRKEYLPYVERDEIMSRTLDSYHKQLNVLETGMKELKSRSERFARSFDQYMIDLKAKKAQSLLEYNAHIALHMHLTKNSNASLRNLAFVSQGAVNKIDSFLKMRERIMRSIERCRKFERVEEKVEPFKSYSNPKLAQKVADGLAEIKFEQKALEDQKDDEWGGEEWIQIFPAIKTSPTTKSRCAIHSDGGCDSAVCTCCEGGDCNNTASNSEDSRPEHDKPEKNEIPNIKSLILMYSASAPAGKESGCALHDGGCDSAVCTCCLDGDCTEDMNRASLLIEDLLIPAEPKETYKLNHDKLNQSIKSMINSFSVLEKFWLRYNRADMERQSLKALRADLLQDNEMLRLALRNYLGGIDPCSVDTKEFATDLIAKRKRIMERMMYYMSIAEKRRELSRRVGVRI